jgi:MoxR-like ATPase
MEAGIQAINERIRTESAFVQNLIAGIGKVIVGQRAMIEGLLISLLTGGHVLLEGVPGLAKTLAVRTLAELIDARFSRIQFTPDLLPADLTGTMARRHVCSQARADLCQFDPGRRDQPRSGQGAIGAARGDAGAPGDDR